MSQYSRAQFSDQDLLSHLKAHARGERTATAELLADIAEVDERKLYLPLGHPSMFSYCVEELHFSEEAACRRIQAARTARRFPAVFAALADGRLHLTAVNLLAAHLRAENAEELLAAATHRSKAQVERLLARYFPRPDVPARLEALAPARSSAPAVAEPGSAPSLATVGELQSVRGAASAPWPKVAPLSAERYALQVTIGQGTHDKLRYAQALLGHAVPSGDLAEVLDRALDALVAQLEKQKFAATARPRPSQRSSGDPRHIPAHVKHAVWERDGGQCTFVGEGGHRCSSCMRLEFDHVDPVACGGAATVEGIRLRCRAHNQYEAECTFGAVFMEHKREAARRAAAEAQQARVAEKERARVAKVQAAEQRAAERECVRAAKAQAAAETRARTEAEQDPERSVIPWLMQLGYRLSEAREAAAHCESVPDAPLEDRLKDALRYFHPRTAARGRAATSRGAAA